MKRSAMLALLLATTACSVSTPAQNNSATTNTATPATADKVGVNLSYLDKSVKPGDNFYDYANGDWMKQAQIPADRASTGAFLDVFNKTEQQNRAIIDAALKDNAPANSDEGKIANYYKAYMDTAGIDKRGMSPIQSQLAEIAAIPDKQALSTMLGSTLRADVDPINATNLHTENLFGLFVTQKLTDPTTTVPYLLQGGLGLPDRSYYLSTDKDKAQIRDAYKKYIAQVLTLAGIDDAQTRAGRIFDLEMKLAKAQASVTETMQMTQGHDPWTKADFAKKAPGIDWDAYWQAAGLPDQQNFVAWQPAAITGEAALVASQPLQAWKDWLTFHRINQLTDVLPNAFDAAHFAFYGTTLSGTPQARPRDKRAIAAVSGALGDAVGQMYVKRYFPASSKTDIQNMVHGILAAFDKRIENLTWMAPATKAEARKKIETLQVGIGYPESWRDYSSLVVKADDPVGNMQRASLAEYHHQIAKIGKPVDRGEWWMQPQTVNAVNLPLQNALNFPAAILQAPFYDPNRDPAANYGSIGAIIGHEISHSFDNNGAQFDAEGRLRNWWTPADLAHFKAQGQALVKQYDAYEPLPGVHINGQQTLGENIADVAGLTAAYEAYHASLNGKPAPVIDGLTGDQRFFLAFAQSWRTKTRDKALKQQIATDGHSPASYRALTVRNLDGWYSAFGVQQGQKLFLAPDKRVHVW